MSSWSNRGAFREAGVVGATVTGVGGALTTIAASACCVSPVLAPLIVGTVGASGAAWASGLKPYSGYILAGSFVLLAASFWTVYRPRASCEAGQDPSQLPIAPRLIKAGLWFGAVLWTASVLVQLILP